jgi:hypothetical protein
MHGSSLSIGGSVCAREWPLCQGIGILDLNNTGLLYLYLSNSQSENDRRATPFQSPSGYSRKGHQTVDPRPKTQDQDVDGMTIFTNAVKYVSQNL